MSLINDALKKASHANKQKQAETPSQAPQAASTPPMQATVSPASSTFPIWIPILIVVLLLGIGALAVVLLSSKWASVEAKLPAPVTPAKPPVAAAPAEAVAKPTVPAAPVVVAPPKAEPLVKAASVPAPAVTVAPKIEPAVIAEPVVMPSAPVVAVEPVPAQPEPVTSQPAVPAVPRFPSIKLQGIFYRMKDPTVMLNGNTVGLGGKVDGVTLTKIERTRVTLEWNGETKVLELR
jgi:hypothetical protein